VVKLFGPEHGVRGEAAAGEKVEDGRDSKTGIPVISLYGKNRKPTSEMLSDVDVLVYDIQDVGSRFYTYISTMILSMEAAAEFGTSFVVLDRPNPLGGLMFDGPVLEDSLRSFVGIVPIPVVYGMTCGELANAANEEGWLSPKQSGIVGKDTSVHARLTMVPMEGWKRSMQWPETGLTWIPPSPNIPTSGTALVYPATCVLEATNVSEGRGTETPFQTIGAPFIHAAEFSTALNGLHIPGVGFRPIEFTPVSSKYVGERCHGVTIEVTDAATFRPGLTGLHIIQQLQKLYSPSFKIKPESFLRLFGSARGYTMLVHCEEPESIVAGWQDDLERYRATISRYLLY